MKHLRRIFLKFYLLFANSKVEAELAREINAHLTLLEDDYLRQGMTPEDARRAARLAYGGVEQAKQLHRDERGFQALSRILQDIRYALRQLRKSPGFTVTAILMLAVGIGATTAIFSIVEGVLLRPLPFPDPDRLVVLGDVLEGSHCSSCAQSSVTPPDIRNYMRDTQSFGHLGGYRGRLFELSGTGDPVAVNGTRMSGEVFAALGVSPLLGRTFTQQEDNESQQVVVLSYGMWRNRFHGNANVLGSKIILYRKPYTVIGVMPRDFEFPLNPGHLNQSEFWLPLSLQPAEFTAGAAASWNSRMVGRLKPGISIEQAQSDAERVARATMRDYPAYMRSLRIHAVVTLLHEDTVAQARPMVRALFFAVIVVLLIVCANLAGLLLVRAIRRRREFAVRVALGARAATLLRQAIVESMVLSIAGGTLGLALAAIALRVGVSLLPQTLPRVNEIGLDWPVMLFALGLALSTGFLCGLAPAFAAIRTSVNETLKEGGRIGTSGSGHARLRSALVVAEIAVALTLLTASGLLLRSFERMRDVKLGFRPENTLAALYVLPHQQYRTQSAIDEFTKTLLNDLEQLPAVTAVGITSFLPAAGNNWGISFTVEGYVPARGAGLNMATTSLVEGDPFGALGIRVLRGRVFNESDNASSQLVAIVNRKMAERYWPGQDAIGKRLRRGLPETFTPWMTVVGEVDDVTLGARDAETTPQVYQPVTQTVASEGVFASVGELSASDGWVVLRSRMDPEQLENTMRAVVRKIDPQLPLYQMQTMEHAISKSEEPRRFNTVLISSFAVAAVLLSVLGIYGVIAFSVALREQEMAVRIALGCQRSGMVLFILSSGARLAGVGCGLGLLGAVAASRLLRSFLFEVSPFDPGVLALSAIAILLLALAASALPARRASSMDPMLALRGE
ncbi:MAG TPA: ABC transporter permease [Terriglobales bacterium]|nr:ABC transporter permease [Terriglobales bacterium]